jgi:hypothetical protein
MFKLSGLGAIIVDKMDLLAGLHATGAPNFILSSAILACYLMITAMLSRKPWWFPVFLVSVLVNIPMVLCFLTGVHTAWQTWYPTLVCAVQMAAVFEAVYRTTFILRCDRERSDARQGSFIVGAVFVCAYGASGGGSYPAPGALTRTFTDFAASGSLLGAIGYVWSERGKTFSPFFAHAIILFTYFAAGVFADCDRDPRDFFVVNALLSFARLGCAAMWVSLGYVLPAGASQRLTVTSFGQLTR